MPHYRQWMPRQRPFAAVSHFIVSGGSLPGSVTEQLLGLEFVFSTMMPGFEPGHFPLLTLNTDAFSFLLVNSTHHVTTQSPFPKPFQSMPRSTICAAPPHSALHPLPQPHMPYSLTNQKLFSSSPMSPFVREHLYNSFTAPRLHRGSNACWHGAALLRLPFPHATISKTFAPGTSLPWILTPLASTARGVDDVRGQREIMLHRHDLKGHWIVEEGARDGLVLHFEVHDHAVS